jgi:hypothetical protein
MGLLGTIVLFALLLGVWPHWPYARRWGYVPGVAVGTLLVVWFILVLLDMVPWWGWTPQAH